MRRPPTGPAELQELRGFLRAVKGRQTFTAIAHRAEAAGWPISERTLRRALDGRLPTRRTVIAFARGTAGRNDPVEQTARIARTAGQLWERAAAAARPAPARPPRMPGRLHQVTTAAGLASKLKHLSTASGLSLRKLAAAPEADGRLSRSALQLILAGKRPPTPPGS